MAWGTVTIGGIAFREEVLASTGSGGAVKITGQDSHPPQTLAAVMAAHLNVLALAGLTVPVVFTDKADLTGFYQVTDAASDLLRFANGSVQSATWSLTLAPLGTERDVELESRLPQVGRSTDLSGPPAAVFWHAPAPATSSYFTGATVPSGQVVRQSAEGAVTVFTGLPVAVFPRWTCPAAGVMAASPRLLLDGIRRVGLTTAASSAWELSNGLVQVTGGADASFTVAAWSPASSGWVSAKGYVPTVNGTALTGVPERTILRNEPGQVIVRLSWPVTGAGRVTVDLSLRRGARAVAGVFKRQAAATLGVTRTAVEAATAVTGGVRAASVDADGNRFVLGSSKTTTTSTATASIAKASVLQLDFFAGHELGAAPAAGDAFADLLGQHLGYVGDDTRVVRR